MISANPLEAAIADWPDKGGTMPYTYWLILLLGLALILFVVGYAIWDHIDYKRKIAEWRREHKV
jgi:hypothetical protein